MLTEVKNQVRVSLLSMKYALMREMLNKVTFMTNIIFMMLNNGIFIIQWVILFSIQDNIGGYNMKQVLLLWGFAASTYGLSRMFFKKAFHISEVINTGKLDSYLVQPKNVLISLITSEVSAPAIGDVIYGYLMLFIYGFSIPNFLLFTLFSMCGSIILVSISVILNSLSFWFQKTDLVADTITNMMVTLATYPEGIFTGVTRVIFYTIVPVGIVNYLPVSVMTNFNIFLCVLIPCIAIVMSTAAALIFDNGLKQYSSSNLMIARI